MISDQVSYGFPFHLVFGHWCSSSNAFSDPMLSRRVNEECAGREVAVFLILRTFFDGYLLNAV
jgi:hypothetical protein